MREELWLYPAANAVHLIGIAILMASVVRIDLRLLGLWREVSVHALARRMLPWSALGLLLIIPSGLSMFSAQAGDLLNNRAFQLKMALLLAAGLNAAIFHTGPFQHSAAWDVGVAPPLPARLSALASLALWLSILTCGVVLPSP